jgi:hypothetical protein
VSALTAAERVAIRREGVAAFLRRPEAPDVTVDALDALLVSFTDAASTLLSGNSASLRLSVAYTNAMEQVLGVEYTSASAARIDALVAALREDVGAALYARLDPRAPVAS